MTGIKRYAAIIERLPIGVFLAQSINSHGKIIDFEIQAVNQHGLDALALSREEIINKRTSEVMHSVYRQAIDWLTQGADVITGNSQLDFEIKTSGSDKILHGRLWFAEKDVLLIALFDSARQLNNSIDPEDTIEKISRIKEEQEILIRIALLLMRANPDDLENVVQITMAEAAKIATADRVYVFNYDFSNRTSNNVYEWCAEGIAPQIDNLQNVPFRNIQEWLDVHENGQCVIIHDLLELPEGNPVKEALGPQDIKSVIAVPLFFEDRLYGFIGFDSVRQQHRYTPKEEHVLQQYGNNLLATVMRIKFEQELRESEARNRLERELYRTILLSVGDGVISTDTNGLIVFANRVFEQMTEFSLHEYIGKPLSSVFQTIDEQTGERQECKIRQVLETGRSETSAEHIAILSKSGKERSIEYSIASVIDVSGKTSGAVLAFRDVTEKRAAQRQIEYLSTHDALTGLFNRHSFGEQIQEVFVEKSLPLSLLVIDVNGLKMTNDAFGHTAGDLLIKSVADIIKDACSPQNRIFRLGGDEFLILLPNADNDRAKAIKNKIIQLASDHSTEHVIISVAVGSCTVEELENDVRSALKDAENDMYHDKIISGRSMRRNTISLIVETINSRYQQEQIHTDRVAAFCGQIGSALNLTEFEIKALVNAGALHDIGKVIIPQNVLCKPGSLTSEEYEIVKRHSETGYQILRAVDDLATYAEAVLFHHERWDGGGYPQGLKGEEIPLFSRIIGVADAFEAMTANRVYRKPLSTEAAVSELLLNAGKQFDPDIVEVFIRILKKTT